MSVELYQVRTDTGVPSKSVYNMFTLVGPKELVPINFLVDLDITAQCARICGIHNLSRNSEYWAETVSTSSVEKTSFLYCR